MNSSLIVFYIFGRTCVWVWPDNNGYITLTSKVETPFETAEFVRILPRTVVFWRRQLLKSVWGTAKPLPGLIRSEESRLLDVDERPNKLVYVCLWVSFTSYHWSGRKDPNQGWVVSSGWASYLWRNVCSRIIRSPLTCCLIKYGKSLHRHSQNTRRPTKFLGF